MNTHERQPSTSQRPHQRRESHASDLLGETELAQSPRMQAQQQALASSFGPSVQRRSADSPRAAPTVQRMSLGGKKIEEAVPFPGEQIATILDHMKGEWNGANNGAVSGGHLLSSMQQKWNGVAVANSTPDQNSAAGVHFAQAIPGNNITSHQHIFRLVRKAGHATHISAPKSSTFWPRDWTEAQLNAAMQHSYRNSADNRWASKTNTSYWYTWQTLGENSAFPQARFAKVD